MVSHIKWKSRFYFRIVASDKGIAGSWHGRLKCKKGFVNGVELKLGDDREGATNIRMNCAESGKTLVVNWL